MKLPRWLWSAERKLREHRRKVHAAEWPECTEPRPHIHTPAAMSADEMVFQLWKWAKSVDGRIGDLNNYLRGHQTNGPCRWRNDSHALVEIEAVKRVVDALVSQRDTEVSTNNKRWISAWAQFSIIQTKLDALTPKPKKKHRQRGPKAHRTGR